LQNSNKNLNCNF